VLVLVLHGKPPANSVAGRHARSHIKPKPRGRRTAYAAPTLTDLGASFAIATGGVLALFIAAPPNGSSVWVRVVDEVSGTVFEQEITADLPANTQFLSPRLFLNNGATAAAVAYDCAGVYLETDY